MGASRTTPRRSSCRPGRMCSSLGPPYSAEAPRATPATSRPFAARGGPASHLSKGIGAPLFSMRSLPIFIDMTGKPAAIVGGGLAAARRAELRMRAGATVTVFAPELNDEFEPLRGRPGLRHEAREPAADDIRGSALCFIATDDERLMRLARGAAKAAGALVNVADKPALGDFIMPSIVDRSPLTIAISTAGASPILGRMLKARLETLISSAY